ncbi:hypothetical protein ACFU76_07375 [Streptomyces sp. NPDC057539]
MSRALWATSSAPEPVRIRVLLPGDQKVVAHLHKGPISKLTAPS